MKTSLSFGYKMKQHYLAKTNFLQAKDVVLNWKFIKKKKVKPKCLLVGFMEQHFSVWMWVSSENVLIL